MKVGIIVEGGMGSTLKLLLEEQCKDIEFAEVTREQVEDDERKIAIVGGIPTCHFDSEDFTSKAICPTWSLSGSGKSGSNKSDRKRDRKNRWR
ncbi:coil containing protein [Vibrio phage 1.137.O._10N.261.46.B5]|nr:coil containing protein [Vibrio phage 1.127.O._10N.286.52.E12]AUR90115.1 coil containing protein [Vibrio phage 1.137.O._10N.261.46.B5]